jgi:hypothetical protein
MKGEWQTDVFGEGLGHLICMIPKQSAKLAQLVFAVFERAGDVRLEARFDHLDHLRKQATG